MKSAKALLSRMMALRGESLEAAELHFEGDSLEVLTSFPDEVKRVLGFSLRQLQIGREPTSQTRSMSSIGAGVYELKEADERAWYRAIYLSKVRSGPKGLPSWAFFQGPEGPCSLRNSYQNCNAG